MARDTVDYEKQYQEDLERAQALSLESLALEQFKKEKLKKELSTVGKNGKTTSVSRASSMTETDTNRNERLQVKSRPRPGTLQTNPTTPLIAPPPPIGQRRNSSTSNNSSVEISTPDLISFSSPPPNNKVLDLQLFNNLPTPPQSQTPQQIPYQPFQQSLFSTNNQITQGYQRPILSLGDYGWKSQVFPKDNNFPIKPINLNLNNSNLVYKGSSIQPNIYAITSKQDGNGSNTPTIPPALPPKNHPSKAQIPPPVPSTLKPQIPKFSTSNLIDLTPSLDDKNSVRVSILKDFDPLLSGSDGPTRPMSPDSSSEEAASMCESVYDEYDPFDYIYSGSGGNSTSEPIYASIASKSDYSPTPPLPPRVNSTLDRRKVHKDKDERKTLLFENVRMITLRQATKDADLSAFYKMVLDVRKQFRYNDPNTNMGLVVSPMVAYKYKDATSIKLIVYPHFDGSDPTQPMSFTCDVTTSVEHVTMQLICGLDAPQIYQYTLKVWGYNEYLAPTSLLCDYEYVHTCIKLDEDIKLILIPDNKVDKSLARTPQDDAAQIKLEDILPNEPVLPISYDNLKILLETLENEMKKLETAAEHIDKTDTPSSLPSLQPSGVIQSVKLVVNLMGNLETIDITEALEALRDRCNQFLPTTLNDTWSEKPMSETIKNNCEKIRSSIQGLIDMYCQAFRVDFEWVHRDDFCDSKLSITEIQDSVLLRVSAIHRPAPDWKYDNFVVVAQVFHGTRPIGKPVATQPCAYLASLYPRILVNTWLDVEDVLVSSLARESRLVLILYGRTLQAPEGGDKEAEPQYKQEEIGWASIQFFNYDGLMINGNILLSIWPKEANYLYGPAPSAGTHPDPNHPVFSIIIAGVPNCYFPPVTSELLQDEDHGDFNSLDNQTQQMLQDVVEKDMLFKIPSNDREVLWEKRHYLYDIPEALPKVLLAAHCWEWACLPDLHGMLKKWKRLKPVEAIQLLLPNFPDIEVRKLAIRWLQELSSDELVDFLPQLVVALRHETYEDSPLAAFLLKRSLLSLRVSHHLFWLLSHSLPENTPQEYKFENDNSYIAEVRHHRRLQLMLRALMAVSGKALGNCLMKQKFLNKQLNDAAETIQKTKESQRIKVLHSYLDTLNANLEENPTSLPLSPTLQVLGIQVRSCSYFPSNTLPLKINFQAKDASLIPAIYKVGDDLQQDMLVLQMVRLMDKLWLKEGLDLKMVTFGCVPTGKRIGIIELVTEAETLRKIHVEHGLTGSFKDKPIAEWLAKHNPSELEYSRAVENFTASCAGYCVVTYILGICDRHNDNIMLKTSGHLFHIDFGKFLGDAQMFGNFKRDRAPFVLTSDMAYVINGGDRPSEKFHKFVDLCCQAFNIIRNNGNLFLYLFTLMASSGIKGVTAEAVNNLSQALLPGLSNPEAAAYFARLIESSLKSWFTQINFFLHNLAQFKLSGEQEGGELLSFVPKKYTMSSDGRLSHVQVLGFRKLYDPDKYYVYILRTWRHNQVQHMDVFRTYKEFCEFHQKLCIHFPLAKLFSLSTGLHVGRSNIKNVARKRFAEITQFIASLFQTAEEICHSDLVYTFFHPLLRDQTSEQRCKKVKDRRIEEKSEIGRLKGQLKLSLHFQRGVFRVMVHHARGLPLLGNNQEPNTYVKVYLQPDQGKTTKRKTKVVRRNCHPSFMETLEYRMSLDIIMERTLRATVWNYDPLQENEFLGGVELELNNFDLSKEITEWYSLVNIVR
ncbi:phosphatidylinositol 4-phosphate 3-kinase C2 domain-containing subunit beta [Onthophagus taurus]|uniref:phosphatidylinositol 4-phosphate 3-kinase C2 domain-containing subunit beta n=1 Tax=Onthophagus taurus TaxID=166361 RepID=UPI0039BE6CBC